ncbi:hypothetical protein AXG93_2210s1140 [Marchantia polymorpha subsp. ruderalis]|uniref:Uncharacterized protein n=1 Tax=Marchantia polymorpha subsp. ruderalis TaxID=1480154 RepID=A0A176VWQ6_MARPO|nr:hypothetical protein AXG93_2210s1140 [Marchantia polymorpha subsp. ruderalis]
MSRFSGYIFTLVLPDPTSHGIDGFMDNRKRLLHWLRRLTPHPTSESVGLLKNKSLVHICRMRTAVANLSCLLCDLCSIIGESSTPKRLAITPSSLLEEEEAARGTQADESIESLARVLEHPPASSSSGN